LILPNGVPAPGAGRRAAGVFRGLLFGARRARGGVPFQHSGCGYGHVTWLCFFRVFWAAASPHAPRPNGRGSASHVLACRGGRNSAGV